MKGTNRKEMRTLLNKCVALMKVAFDNGLNMDVNTRLNGNNRPWFIGHVYVEGCEFSDKTQDGVTYLYFTCYEWRDAEENLEQLNRVEEFINNHKK